MSIYSGFATRVQQQTYDQCIDSLLYILQRRIIKFYKGEEADEEKFVNLVLKIHHQLKSMESNKYLDPKTSTTILELVKYMQIHQKNTLLEKSKTPFDALDYPSTHEPPPKDEEKDQNQENGNKKKSLWVQKAPKRNVMVDQEMQTMGTILDKKDSPKAQSASRVGNQRQAISSLRTKYGDKFSGGKYHRPELPPPTHGHSFKNRSQSHHLGNNDIYHYDYEVRNHLREMQTTNKKKRKAKLSYKLGLKDLPTEEKSQYEVGDIIKDYVTRVRRKVDKSENQKSVKDNRMNDF